MTQDVAIIGIGFTSLRPDSGDLSFREMIFEAAQRAYKDAGIEPIQIDTVVSVTEDYLEGTAIADEYVPDQLGAVLKPVHTIGSDGITALASAFLQIKTGEFGIAVIEGRSKASNIVYPSQIEAMALDPINVRPLGIHPCFVPGLEMRAFLDLTKNTEEHAATIVEKNRNNAMFNPMAAYGRNITSTDVLNSPIIAAPLKELDVAAYADGAIVMVLATRELAANKIQPPIYIKGIGWAQDTPNLEERHWARAIYAENAAYQAYKLAGINKPYEEIDFAEIDDTFSYKELQHVEALGLSPTGMSGNMLDKGDFYRSGRLPVNVSGGALGCGYTYGLNGLRSVLEVVLQLRGEAGSHQLHRANVGLAQSWRGSPQASGGVVILGRD